MNKPKDKIEELFQNHSDDFDRMPDDSLWDNIEAHLPPATPVYRLWRWGLAAALLLFSLVGYVAYEFYGTNQQTALAGKKENTSKRNADSENQEAQKSTKNELEEPNQDLVRDYATQDEIAALEAEKDNNKTNDDIRTEEKEKTSIASTVNKQKLNKASNKLKSTNEASIAQNSQRGTKQKTNKPQISSNGTSANGIAVVNSENSTQMPLNATETSDSQAVLAAQAEAGERLSGLASLAGHPAVFDNEIAFNTAIASEPEYKPEEKKESFFKAPSELYVSLTPSLNYYRVISTMPINQFNAANNGGRVGWAVQAGAVYPLKIRRMNYRVGLSYFSTQSNFKYNVFTGRQQTIRLDNNTFGYVNIDDSRTESKRWHVLEIQNDLMYKIRPMHDLILGFKAGSSFSEKPVFDAYTGYRLSKQVNHRQIFWIEAAYAYAINGQQSSRNAFSYHMDKYSLRIGVNFR